jgi:hypothetical protein
MQNLDEIRLDGSSDDFIVNPDTLYMVHLSSILIENSTKIAGAALLQYDNSLNKKPTTIETENTNIRRRITLHHCIGGPVPEGTHGLPVDLFGKLIKLTSSVYNDNSICAYLDPLSAFTGELIGGFVTDMFSIDRHIYGAQSIIIVPESIKPLFIEKNSNFNGELITFDPNEFTIHEKVKQVIKAKNALSFDDIKPLILNGDHKILNDFFLANNLPMVDHNHTNFRALERVLTPFWKAMYAMQTGIDVSPHILPVEEVFCHLSIIKTLFPDIIESSKMLDEKSRLALTAWQQDTNNWLNLFEVDAILRKKSNTSIFIANDNFACFVQNKDDKNKLFELAINLVKFDQNQLLLESRGVFSIMLQKKPKFSIYYTLNYLEDFLNFVPLTLLEKINTNLENNSFSIYGNAMIVLKLLSASIIQKPLEQAEESLLVASLNKLQPSPQIQLHIKKIIKSCIYDDHSSFNQNTVTFLNNHAVGKAIRKHIFGCQDNITFAHLIPLYSKKLAEKEYTKPQDARFIQLVKQWLYPQALQASLPYSMPETTSVTLYCPEKNLPNPYNIRGLINLSDMINNYLYHFSTPIYQSLFHKNSILPDLIKKNFSLSYSNLLYHVMPSIRTFRPELIEKCLKVPLASIYSLSDICDALEKIIHNVNEIEQKFRSAREALEQELEKSLINSRTATSIREIYNSITLFLNARKRIFIGVLSVSPFGENIIINSTIMHNFSFSNMLELYYLGITLAKTNFQRKRLNCMMEAVFKELSIEQFPVLEYPLDARLEKEEQKKLMLFSAGLNSMIPNKEKSETVREIKNKIISTYLKL